MKPISIRKCFPKPIGARRAMKPTPFRRIVIFGVFACLMAMSPPVFAESMTFGFYNITNNNSTDAEIGETQLKVDVVDTGIEGQVKFVFRNEGPEESAITRVYFDDGTLLEMASVIDADEGGDPGVKFDDGGTSPPDLPGGDSITPKFEVTAGFLADAENPGPEWGVNPYESLGVVFTLKDMQTYSDVISALKAVDHLRIGIHVQDFEGGGSESFVNNPNSDGSTPESPGVMPEPASLSLFGIGLVAMYGYRRRKQKQQTEDAKQPKI